MGLTSALVFADPPEAPGLPIILDWSETTVTLKWEGSINDGGAPISGYIIELMDKFAGPNYVKCAEVNEPMCEGVVSNLIEGKVYQFRVLAVNKMGPGAPSEETDQHTARARFRKYYFLLP
jgi:hypothetical protein